MEFFDAQSMFDMDGIKIDGEYSSVELCEVAGNLLYAETGNFRQACWYVVALALRMGCDGLLRMDIEEIFEEYQIQVQEFEDGAE